jgi:outer membrane protein assembly factor BamB
MLNRILTAAAILTATTLSAADWPNFLGPNRDSISTETGLNKNWNAQPPRELWRVPMSDDGYAGPSVANGKVFIINHAGDKDIVRALDLKTGKDIWTYTYADKSKPNYGFARATPTVENGKVYTVSRFGVVNCLDEKTGKPIWTKDVVKESKGEVPRWEMAWSPFIDGDKIIVQPGGSGATVAALNKNTGATLWKGGGSDAPGYGTAVIATLAGKKQYLVFTAKHLIGVDAADGKLLWKVAWETKYDVNAATPLVVGPNKVFISSNYARGCAMVTVTGNNASIAWENKELQCHFNSPILFGNHIYGISNELACLDPQTGKALWKQPGFEKGGLVIADGVIIAMDGKAGDVVMAEASPRAYRELGRIKPLGGQSWTAPIIADGKLIIRNKNTLACLALK